MSIRTVRPAGLRIVVTSVALGLTVAACCGASQPARQVVACVDGEAVYLDEVEPRVAFQLYKLRSEIHRLLVRETEALVSERLLEAAAERQGLPSVEELLAREIDGRVAPVSEAEVDEYLREHPPAKASAAEARVRVRAYLTERRRIERRLELVAGLQEAAGFELTLEAPALPRTEIDVADASQRGADDAAIVIVHFADFHDRKSSESAAAIRELAAAFPGRIREVYRPYFRMGDETALHAAELALAAQQAGRFWEYHDRLMSFAGELDTTTLDGVAAELGVTLGAAREASLRRLKAAITAAHKVGVTHTPVFFVNGRYLSGTFPLAQLRRRVREELTRLQSGGADPNEITTAADSAGGF